MEGVQQVDPIGPLIFSLLTLSVAERLKSALKVMHLDDGVDGGVLADVKEDLQIFMNFEAETGLSLNSAKCQLFTFSGSASDRSMAALKIHSIAPLITVPFPKCVCLLGSPLLPEAISKELQWRKASIQTLCSRLALLSRHHAMNCLSAPKLSHLLRTSLSWKLGGILKELDTIQSIDAEYLKH